jgi:hypothetical protein
MRYQYIIFVMAVSSLGLLTAPPTLAELNDGLVAYYPFDGNAQDMSGNGHHGMVHGATLTTDRFGNADSAYHFDGNSHIVTSTRGPSDAEIKTVAAWIKVDSSPSSLASIVSLNFAAAEGSPGWWPPIEYTANNTIRTYTSYGYSNGVGTPGKGIWYHVAVVTDRNQGTFYINGEAQGYFSGNWDYNGSAQSSFSMSFGAYSYIDRSGNQRISDLFTGTIDDIKIYNRALSNAEIKTLYQAVPAISGCTDSNATSYNPEATVDDGSCQDNNLLFIYTAEISPYSDGWNGPSGSATESIENGVLHLVDSSSRGGSYKQYFRSWTTVPSLVNVAELDIKLVSNNSIHGTYFGISDGSHYAVYTLYQDRIVSSYIQEGTYYFDTTSDFNTYRAFIQDGIAKLYINGQLALEHPARQGTWSVVGIEFGAGSSAAITEAYFSEIRAYQMSNPEPLIISGCTDPNATNYNSNATADDGSCEFPIAGCTDSNATNYNPNATADDGSCQSQPATGDCQHASYNLKDKTLFIPFLKLPVIDVWNKQATGGVEMWKGTLKQKHKTTDHFRILYKTLVPIAEGTSSTCPATYSSTGLLSIPYIDVPTAINVGNRELEGEGIEVFKATLKWEPENKVFVVQEIEKQSE